MNMGTNRNLWNQQEKSMLAKCISEAEGADEKEKIENGCMKASHILARSHTACKQQWRKMVGKKRKQRTATVTESSITVNLKDKEAIIPIKAYEVDLANKKLKLTF